MLKRAFCIYFLHTDTSVCPCAGLCWFICVFMWVCSCVGVCVRNAWPRSEEWLLYSCLVGAMGATAVSLGSCMDGLRRSPSFIKRAPTCRIDLAKKQGGNSSSSVFPDHKSLGGVPPPGGEVTPLSVRRSPRTTEGAGQQPSLIRWLRKCPAKCEQHPCGTWAQKNICAINNIKGKKKKRLLQVLLADKAAKSGHKNK